MLTFTYDRKETHLHCNLTDGVNTLEFAAPLNSKNISINSLFEINAFSGDIIPVFPYHHPEIGTDILFLTTATGIDIPSEQIYPITE